MAELCTLSQSSLLLRQFHSCMPKDIPQPGGCYRGFAAAPYAGPISISRGVSSPRGLFAVSSSICLQAQHTPRSWEKTRVVSDPKASNLIIEMAQEKHDFEPDNGGGGFGDEGSGKGHGGGGGGGGDGGDQNDNADANDESGDDHSGKSSDGSKIGQGLSMSQKLTLAYAALVGFGGVMGYLKGGSQKSLAAGGLSALVLYFVYTQLPTNPVFASSVGLGMSAALLVVMGSRFKKSRKVFPAGVVSLVSLVMTGGYMHGIMRTMH